MKDVIHLFDWYKLNYKESIKDMSNLRMAKKTCSAYDGLVHPMKETPDGKFMPDFHYRYMTEVIPFGMVVFRGIAQLAGVPTPAMDETLTWGQKILGKAFLVVLAVVESYKEEDPSNECLFVPNILKINIFNTVIYCFL